MTTAEQPPRAALRRAQELADRAQSELRVLRVLSERQLSSAPVMRFVEAVRATSRHCRDALADRYADDRLALVTGTLSEAAASHAVENDAALLILPAGELRGRDVTALARATGLPVMVLRPAPREVRLILAATDLTRPDYPVLRSARALAALRGCQVLALHAFRRRRLAAECRAKLQRAARVLGLDDAVLLSTRDATSAILAEAHERAADVIVVGTHTRTALGRAVRSSVAAKLIDRTHGSVWVEPIAG
ncbi:MAG TPA: universal stress protein [Polyangiales bacterium]|nr:universal stress protein [Polyangiales bacterium]